MNPPATRKYSLAYRPDIDGLRAAAVISVLTFHASPALAPGGFVGVDIFFVISGFLITSIIAVEMRADNFSILSFYDRRIRRIVPAFVTLLAASIVLGYFILWPGDYEDLGESAGYASVGLANLFFRNGTGYFNQRSELQPLLHLWSLGVEEQFYFVWPPVLFLMMRVFGLKQYAQVIVLVVLIVVAFVAAVLAERADPIAAFFLTRYRAWELGVGCLLAILPPLKVGETARELAALVGLSLVACAILVLNASSRYPGANALLPCIGAGLIVWSSADTPSFIGRCFSWRPVRLIGLISYSLYLIHWPALVFMRHYDNGGNPSPIQIALVIVASLVLAWLSWRYVEQPFREHRLKRATSVVVGLATVASVAFVGFALAANSGLPSRVSDHQRPLLSLDIMWNWSCPRVLMMNKTTLCQFGSTWADSHSRAFLWGDSHAEHLVPLLDAAGARTGTAYVLNRQCPAVLGGMLRLNIPANQMYNNNAHCVRTRQAAMEMLRSHPEIDTVILASAWQFLIKLLRREPSGAEADGYALLQLGLQEVVDSIGKNRTVVLVGDFPFLPIDPIECLAGESLWRRHCNRTDLQISNVAYEKQQGGVNHILRFLAATNPNVKAIIPGDVLCKNKLCITDWNEEFLYRDPNHIRRNLTPRTRDNLAKALGF